VIRDEPGQDPAGRRAFRPGFFRLSWPRSP